MNENDIVIDASVTPMFESPPSPDYQDLIVWLRDKGAIAVSQLLLIEIKSRTQGKKDTSLPVIIDLLLRKNRVNFFRNSALKLVKIKKSAEKRLISGWADQCHVRLVLASHRKLLLSDDNNLIKDVNTFRGIGAKASRKPSDLDYC